MAAAKRARSAARQNPSHWRVKTRPNGKNAQEMWGNCSGLSFVVVGLSMQSNFRAMQPTGQSEINLSLHLHSEIGLSNASDIYYAHPLST